LWGPLLVGALQFGNLTPESPNPVLGLGSLPIPGTNVATGLGGL